MTEVEIDLLIFLILTPLIAVNLVAFLPIIFRLHREGHFDLRPLTTAIILCHLSTFLVCLTWTLILSAAVWWPSRSPDVVNVLRFFFYASLVVMIAETITVGWWRWRS